MALFFSAVANAQQPEEEAVPLEVLLQQNKETGPFNRSAFVVQIEGCYYPSLETVYLTFLSDLGSSTITVTSVSAGTVDDYTQNGAGICIIPISNSGLIIIDIYSGDGRHYRAIFIA